MTSFEVRATGGQKCLCLNESSPGSQSCVISEVNHCSLVCVNLHLQWITLTIPFPRLNNFRTTAHSCFLWFGKRVSEEFWESWWQLDRSSNRTGEKQDETCALWHTNMARQRDDVCACAPWHKQKRFLVILSYFSCWGWKSIQWTGQHRVPPFVHQWTCITKDFNRNLSVSRSEYRGPVRRVFLATWNVCHACVCVFERILHFIPCHTANHKAEEPLHIPRCPKKQQCFPAIMCVLHGVFPAEKGVQG